jgi:hypothetical protein
MTTKMRLLCFLSALVVLAGLAWVRPEWTEAVGEALTGGDSGRVEEARRRREELVKRDGVLFRRIAAKEEVIRELIAGRLSLWQAARWFKQLNENPRDLTADYLEFFPGATDDEKQCRQVLDWTRLAVQRLAASRASALLARLEAELEERRRLGGGLLTLPTE